MRGEFVLPRSEFNTTVPLFTVPLSKEQHKDIISEIPYLLKRASLPGQHLQDLSRKHNISSRLSQRESMKSFAIGELKELVLGSLEDLLCSQYYKMYLLPVDSRSPVFVPMIKAMDDLLVVGALNQEHDFQRVLHLLDPLEFTLPTSESEFSYGVGNQSLDQVSLFCFVFVCFVLFLFVCLFVCFVCLFVFCFFCILQSNLKKVFSTKTCPMKNQ